MLKNFRSYGLAVELYKDCRDVKLPSYLKDQLMRAASSVALNLSEGSVKPTRKERLRFYTIAFGSLREVQSVFDLLDSDQDKTLDQIIKKADHLGACLYKLVHQP